MILYSFNLYLYWVIEMNYLQVIELLQKIENNTRYVSMKTNLIINSMNKRY